MSSLRRLGLLALATLALLPAPAPAAEHPFILWTRDEAAALRKRIETEPWAKAAFEAMLKETGRGGTLRNLFRYVVMGERKPGEDEKKYLLHIVGTHPRQFEKLEHGGRHYDCYLDVLRYDGVYDLLTPDERQGVEKTFRAYIAYQLEDKKLYTRTSWLPNMQWPRPMAAHLMAVGLADQDLILKLIHSNGGWKWYFDEYLADRGFYMEEFGKQYSMLGEMLLFCRGLERLGLNQWGYGYVGKGASGGATMRAYLESIPRVVFPRIAIPGEKAMPQYPKLTMGDARSAYLKGGPPYGFQHSMVDGYLPDGTGGNDPWHGANMNGRDHRNTKIDKLNTPQWFEIAHATWPDAGFDYFLAQMRPPGTRMYTPTLFWGCPPIDPAKVKPPPAPSYVAPQRGFIMLRAEEGPGYWESPAPAVGFQLATYYVHYAHDAFALLGLHAFNRPIYLNRQISNGYGGGCPWTDSMRGHCGVVVDNLQFGPHPGDPAKDIVKWPSPIGAVATRFARHDAVKFAAARGVPLSSEGPAVPRPGEMLERGAEIWPGVVPSRALVLTKEYLLDVFHLESGKPHRYEWQVHALGQAWPEDAAAWQPTDELKDRLYDMSHRAIEARLKDPIEYDRYQMKDVRKLVAGERPWSFRALQACQLADPTQSILGEAWYARKIGVRVSMLGEPGTTVFAGKSPEVRRAEGKEKSKGEKSDAPNEVGGVTLIAAREAASTAFVALHEPFEKGQPRLAEFRRIQQAGADVAVAMAGPGLNDRVLVRGGREADKPLTLAGDGESFTFADWALVRIGPEQVEVFGGLSAMKVKVTGQPKLRVNGQEQTAKIEGGVLWFEGKERQ